MPDTNKKKKKNSLQYNSIKSDELQNSDNSNRETNVKKSELKTTKVSKNYDHTKKLNRTASDELLFKTMDTNSNFKNPDKTSSLLSPQKLRLLFLEQQPIPSDSALSIIHKAKDILSNEPNVLSINAPIKVFGDIHGQFYDLINFSDQSNLESPSDDNQFLFLGDFVDRGSFSCEVILYILCLKINFPKHVFLLRGNHESEAISTHYGFRVECMHKYGLSVYYHFISCFQSLPIASIIHTNYGDIFAVHGGISPTVIN